MTKFIETIERTIEGRQVYIELKGKNLILVGNNGAGKTKFLTLLDSILTREIKQRDLKTKEQYIQTLKESRINLQKLASTSSIKVDYEKSIEILIKEINNLNVFNVTFTNITELRNEVTKERLLYRYFPANRAFSSAGNNLLKSIDELFELFKQSSINKLLPGSYFESYLVSMSNYALIEKGAGEIEEYERISHIISKIESDLKTLFEDDSLTLTFNRKSLRMEIVRSDNAPFRMELLPSGYASILAVYTELVMLSELGRMDKNDIHGIVLIDEIDAHLHVTVQKKVLDFFTTSFPGIQFIISTHSPFVVQSVSDAIIYNLSTHEQLEDLSAYSYTSIIKGLLGETSNSNELEKTLEDIDNLSKSSDFGDRFHELVTFLDGHFKDLDPRAKAILMSAKSRHVDWEEREDNV